ncbi:MAG: hypothetical protein ACE5ED_02820, partial [Rhodothalassiaceae bacterium]
MVTQMVTRDGRAIALQYDALGRLVLRDLPGTAADRSFVHDRLGRVVAVRLTSGETVSMAYDRLSRVLSVTAGGRRLAYDYDAAGNRVAMTWPD